MKPKSVLLTMFVLATIISLIVACAPPTTLPAPQVQEPQAAAETPAAEAEATAEAIKIGFYAPITGPAAADGEAATRGGELATQLINEQGGILGRPVELVVYDDAFSPDEAANVTRRLIEQDKVAAVVSGSYSFTTRAGAPIAQEAGIPFMAAYAVHPSVTETGEYVWRIGALATVQGLAGAELVANNLGAKDVAILVIDNDFGVSLVDAFKARAAELGLNIVYEEKYPLGESDFRPLLGGIAAANPEALYATGYYAEAASLVSQMAEAGMDIQVVGQEGYDSPTFLKLAGDAANDVIFTTDLDRDSERPAVQEFLKRFQETYDEQADAVAASAFDAVRVIAAGIEAGGATEPARILEGLRSLENFDQAVTGPIIRFTEGREVVRPIGAQIVRDNAFHHYTEIDDLDLVTPPQ